MTARQIARAVLDLRAETELLPTPNADDRAVWARLVAEQRVDARTAMYAARVHYENRPEEPLTERAWLAALRKVRAVHAARPTPPPNPREALALARIAAASRAMPCPECGARPGEGCTNRLTGLPYAHGWHVQRTVTPSRVSA